MKNLFLFPLLILTASACNSDKILDITDGFESNELSHIWRSDKFVPGALDFQSKIVRSGKSAAKITLNPGDQINNEKGTILERAEIMEASKFTSIENSTYLYEFSLFLPADFPVVPSRLVIAQWKQKCRANDCDPDNPVIAVRYASGELDITLQTGPNKTILYSQTDDIRDKWLDFKFQICFSRQERGRIIASMNDQRIIDYTGITAYTEDYGYHSPGYFYFKTGLYRDKIDQSMTIYIDDFNKRLIREK